jgi:uncharacterized membrane protein YfcA
MLLLIVIALGAVAGTLTTVAGLGGGMMLILALSHVVDPHWALACSALPLLIGNLHRVSLFREHLSRKHVLALCSGAVPGALLGGLAFTMVPAAPVRWLMLAMTTLAVVRALGWWRWQLRTRALAPAGAVIGALTASTGGGGLLMAPLLMTAGVHGDRYIATASAVCASMHLARLAGYGVGGLVDLQLIGYAVVTAFAIMMGNALGKRLRRSLDPGRSRVLMFAALIVCTALAVGGVR